MPDLEDIQMASQIRKDVAELYGDLGLALQAVVTIAEATDDELVAKAQSDLDGAKLTADGLHTAMEHRCYVLHELLAFSESRLRAAISRGLVVPFPKPEGTS
jgi:hypothetical protein